MTLSPKKRQAMHDAIHEQVTRARLRLLPAVLGRHTPQLDRADFVVAQIVEPIFNDVLKALGAKEEK